MRRALLTGVFESAFSCAPEADHKSMGWKKESAFWRQMVSAPLRWTRVGDYLRATPQGSSPTAMSVSRWRRAVSITDTLLERPLAT